MTVRKKAKTFQYEALCFSQRDSKQAPHFVLFHAPAADIIEWADVDRLEPDNLKGAQRPLRGLKVNKLSRFLDTNPRNTIPTAVVVALDADHVKFSGKADKDKHGEHGTLTISVGKNRPGLIIDGQHRAFGVAKHSGSVHLNVVAFLGGDDAERAFQFVVINNSATRVSKDHIRALSLSFDHDALNKRLIDSAGVALGLSDTKYEDFRQVDNRGPFKGLLSWPTNESGYVAPNAIEGALNLARDRAALLGIEELELEFLMDIWTRIKKLRPTVWHKNSKEAPSHLLEKVSIYALTLYILDSLEAASRMVEERLDFTDEPTLHKYVDKVVTRIPEEFWTSDWQAKELDTSSGRQLLLETLKMIDANSRFDRPWYDKIALIDPAQLTGQYGSGSKGKKKKKKK